jgi:hypothetical protein
LKGAWLCSHSRAPWIREDLAQKPLQWQHRKCLKVHDCRAEISRARMLSSDRLKSRSLIDLGACVHANWLPIVCRFVWLCFRLRTFLCVYCSRSSALPSSAGARRGSPTNVCFWAPEQIAFHSCRFKQLQECRDEVFGQDPGGDLSPPSGNLKEVPRES